MKLSAVQLNMIRTALFRTFKKNPEGEWQLATRQLDPSEELDALSIHKKVGAHIVDLGTEKARMEEGEVEFTDSEKAMAAKFVAELRLTVEEIEEKNALLELLK